MPSRLTTKPGPVFTPGALSTMSEAFDDVVAALKISDEDETRREAVAQFIMQLSDWDESLDAAALRDRTLAALNGLRPKRKRHVYWT